MIKFQRQLPGDRGQSSPRRHQLLGQPRAHAALFKLSQAHKSLGTGKTCAQPWQGDQWEERRGVRGRSERDETDRWKKQEKRARAVVPKREARKHEEGARTQMDGAAPGGSLRLQRVRKNFRADL